MPHYEANVKIFALLLVFYVKLGRPMKYKRHRVGKRYVASRALSFIILRTQELLQLQWLRQLLRRSGKTRSKILAALLLVLMMLWYLHADQRVQWELSPNNIHPKNLHLPQISARAISVEDIRRKRTLTIVQRGGIRRRGCHNQVRENAISFLGMNWLFPHTLSLVASKKAPWIPLFPPWNHRAV